MSFTSDVLVRYVVLYGHLPEGRQLCRGPLGRLLGLGSALGPAPTAFVRGSLTTVAALRASG